MAGVGRLPAYWFTQNRLGFFPQLLAFDGDVAFYGVAETGGRAIRNAPVGFDVVALDIARHVSPLLMTLTRQTATPWSERSAGRRKATMTTLPAVAVITPPRLRIAHQQRLPHHRKPPFVENLAVEGRD